AKETPTHRLRVSAPTVNTVVTTDSI
ncbi:uncharacterized protein METZ01_LOCUS370993, partial [marine metagenome]